MGYKLVALDVDGTIRSDGHVSAERMRKAIAAVQDAGALVTLATGRLFRSAVRVSAEFGISAPIVSSQGAHIAAPETGRVLWHRPLTVTMARSALDALDGWEGDVIGYAGDHIYVGRTTPWVAAYSQRNRVTLNVVGDLKLFDGAELTRLVVVGDEGEVEGLEARLQSRFGEGLHVTRSLPHFCEVLHPEGGKHRALAWLCDYLGIRQEDTMAFGNGYNDVHMLEWAGLGVAVGGAVAQAVEAADMLAPPIEAEGAAQVLEDLLKRGLIG